MAEFRKTLPNCRLSPSLEGNIAPVRRNTYGFEDPEVTSKDKTREKKNAGMGFDFIGLMFITQLVMKWVQCMTVTGEAYLFMGYHIPAPTMQVYTAITSLPGILKPLLGLISDAFPIMGYTKTPYGIVLSITGLAGMFVCGFSPEDPMQTGLKSFTLPEVTQPTFSVGLLLVCLFFVHLMISMSEVFTAGVLAEKVNQTMDDIDDDSAEGKKTFNMIGFFVVIGMVAGIGASFVCGQVLTTMGAPTLYLIGGCMATLLPIWVMFRGFGEPKLTPEQLSQVRKFLAGQKEVVGLTILLSVGCLFMLFVPMLAGNGTLINFFVALGTSAVIIASFSVLLTPVIARMLLCFFVFSATNFNIGGAMMYFCVDNKYQFPGGPNFSKMFVTFWLPLVGTIAGFLGCMAFKSFGTGFTLRNWEIMTTVIMAPTLCFNLIWVYRINITWGISDATWAIFEICVMSFFSALQSMPYTFALPRLCPVGLESSMMQLLGGCIFMGGIVAEDIGALILQWFEITPSGAFFEQDQFDNFGKVMLIKSVIGFTCCLMVLPLLPNVLMADKLIQNDRHDAATYGSIWKTWMKKRSSGKKAAATA